MSGLPCSHRDWLREPRLSRTEQGFSVDLIPLQAETDGYLIMAKSLSSRIGWTSLNVLAIMATGSATELKHGARSAASEIASPALQGEAALAELERRGEKASLMTAFDAAMTQAQAGAGLTGPTYFKMPFGNAQSGNRFGYAVAMSGDIAVIAAPLRSNLGTGMVFVFVRSGSMWTLQAVLGASDVGQQGEFGRSVAVSGKTIAVGVKYQTIGAVYVWERTDTNWSVNILQSSNPAVGDEFGWSVALSGRTLVVGAPGEDGGGVGVNPPYNEAAPGSGAAYVFVGNGTDWTQQAYLKASNTGLGDAFGTSVGIAGDTVFVGAPGEDGSGTGMNPQSTEGAADAGAAYIFARTGSSWNAQAYLKPSNPGPGDAFGGAVAASWRTLVVGAAGEDGSGTGLDPAPDEGAPSSGAAYVFVENGSAWNQQAYLKASNTGSGDGFGGSVAISGNTVVVGANGEDGSGVGVDPLTDENADGAGAAYVFERSGAAWHHQAYLKASNTGAGDQFGLSVAVSGRAVIAGAPFEDGSGTFPDAVPDENAADSGAAYAFETSNDPSLVYLNIDYGGDALIYGSSTGEWSRQSSVPAGGFVEQNAGAWSPGWSVLPANFNGDELTDFFLFNSISGAWSTMLAGETGFTTESSGTWWPGWQRYIMELNGDGISDVFLYDPLTGAWFKCVSVVGGFSYSQGGWNPGWELYPMALNADAFTDLFLFNRSTGRWFWALGESGAGFSYPLSETWYPDWQLYPGDFNGDRLTDLLLHHPSSGTYFVATTTASSFTYVQGVWSLGWTPHVADVDGDLRHDVFLHDEATGAWAEMISDGVGGFTNAGSQVWTLGWQLHFTDVNADGRADLLLYDPSTGAWYLARNLVNGSFTYSSGTWAAGLTIVTRSSVRMP